MASNSTVRIGKINKKKRLLGNETSTKKINTYFKQTSKEFYANVLKNRNDSRGNLEQESEIASNASVVCAVG